MRREANPPAPRPAHAAGRLVIPAASARLRAAPATGRAPPPGPGGPATPGAPPRGGEAPGPGAGQAEDTCELCTERIGPVHGHRADLEPPPLDCACRACYLLFTEPGAGRGRYRA